MTDLDPYEGMSQAEVSRHFARLLSAEDDDEYIGIPFGDGPSDDEPDYDDWGLG